MPENTDADGLLAVPCFQAAIFGISTPPPKVKVHAGMMTYNNGFILSVLPGVDNRLYWFFFLNLHEPAYGKDAPRFTKDDEARVVREHSDESVMPGLKLGDLYYRSEVTVMTALQEHVFKKWHFQRIITFGDAAHKVSLICRNHSRGFLEQSGLTVRLPSSTQRWGKAQTRPSKQLLRLRTNCPGCSRRQIAPPTTRFLPHSPECRSSGSTASRHSWTKRRQLAGRTASRPPLMSSLSPVMPRLDPVMTLNGFMDDFVDGVRLENIPVPYRPKFVPFSDELPSRPLKAAVSNMVTALTALLLATMVYHLTRVKGCGTWPGPTAIIPSSWVSEAVGADLTMILIYHVLVSGTIFFMWTLDGQRVGNGSSVCRW